MSIKTLVINPGSTSTKVGVFEDETLLFEETLRHPTEEIAKYASVIDQKDFIGLRQFVAGRNTAFDQFRQIQFLVVNGDDYGNHWFFFFHDPPRFIFLSVIPTL